MTGSFGVLGIAASLPRIPFTPGQTALARNRSDGRRHPNDARTTSVSKRQVDGRQKMPALSGFLALLLWLLRSYFPAEHECEGEIGQKWTPKSPAIREKYLKKPQRSHLGDRAGGYLGNPRAYLGDRAGGYLDTPRPIWGMGKRGT